MYTGFLLNFPSKDLINFQIPKSVNINNFIKKIAKKIDVFEKNFDNVLYNVCRGILKRKGMEFIKI
jgi:hypothetical protein